MRMQLDEVRAIMASLGFVECGCGDVVGGAFQEYLKDTDFRHNGNVTTRDAVAVDADSLLAEYSQPAAANKKWLWSRKTGEVTIRAWWF